MQTIHTFSDGFGAGHAFPMWPQIIQASGFPVVNHSEVSISVVEMLDLYYANYNTEDRFIVQLPCLGRVIGVREPAEIDESLAQRDVVAIEKFKQQLQSNVSVCTVEDMDSYSCMFKDRGDQIQPQPVVHARWLCENFPELISSSIYEKLEYHGYWEPYHPDRAHMWSMFC